MNSVRYVGLDVHRDTISAAVLNESGRLIQQSILATRAAAILDLVAGIRGTLHITFEEGTHSAWLYGLLVRRVEKLVVQPAQERAVEVGQQERCDRCAQAGRVVARRAAVGGLSRREQSA